MSSKIKILNAEFEEVAVISAASSAARTERINSDNTLNFSFPIKKAAAAYVNDNAIYELDGDYFDTAYYKKEQQSDGRLMVSVETEHISYRLNNKEFNVEYFTEMGTPEYILGKILAGTPFTVGTVDFTDTTTFSLQEVASRRGLLVQFAAYLGGELEYDGFTVSILAQRGSSTPKALTVGKDITVVSKSVDKRNLDDLGNPTIAYTCGVYKGASLALGDVVTLDYEALDIDVSLRVVSKTHDPYNPNNVVVEIGNYVSGIEDDLYRIETNTVAKGKKYYGARISADVGFESVRNDKFARALFNADEFAMQTGDGSGSNWTNVLYFDAVQKKWFFDGELTANVINVLSALITPNLYAGKASIAELTVDQLDTSNAAQKYLDEDATDDNFQRIYDQWHDFLTAHTDGADEDKVQVTDRNGNPLYWVDTTYTASTTDDTGLPVWKYLYTEAKKMRQGFRNDLDETENYNPIIEMGAGTGTGDNDKLLIYKLQDKAIIKYITDSGDEVPIEFTDYVDAKMRRISSVAINKTAGTVTVYMEGESQPMVLSYTETATSMTFEWPDGHSAAISIS